MFRGSYRYCDGESCRRRLTRRRPSAAMAAVHRERYDTTPARTFHTCVAAKVASPVVTAVRRFTSLAILVTDDVERQLSLRQCRRVPVLLPPTIPPWLSQEDVRRCELRFAAPSEPFCAVLCDGWLLYPERDLSRWEALLLGEPRLLAPPARVRRGPQPEAALGATQAALRAAAAARALSVP